jgi:hypothetical protein
LLKSHFVVSLDGTRNPRLAAQFYVKKRRE